MTLGDLVALDSALPERWMRVDVTGLTADSREVEPGFLFAALPGTETDGARFIPDALARGATAVLIPKASLAAQAIDIPVVEDSDPRRCLALMAARFFGAQPETIAAVTGTNGKTSVAAFLRQIWDGLGARSASLGTIGVVTPDNTRPLIHTTPEPVTLHRVLRALADEGITHLALEASSHGLQQRRLDGVRLAAAAFTNISRDHLDYHDDFDAYLAQKLRLFDKLLPEGAAVVVDADAPGSESVRATARARGLRLVTVGRAGDDLRLVAAAREGSGQRLTIVHDGHGYDVLLPLVGDFQSANALVAAGLAMAVGGDADAIIGRLATLEGAPGRLERVGAAPSGAPIFIDYAHTPDALANALAALRPYAASRVIVVFGCGGDRDQGKRPDMGRVAREGADLVYVTDDNPRGEDPAAIRAAILAALPGATEIGDRRAAIAAAIDAARAEDLVLIAGKGHETGQVVGGRIIPFSDHDAVRAVLGGGQQ